MAIKRKPMPETRTLTAASPSTVDTRKATRAKAVAAKAPSVRPLRGDKPGAAAEMLDIPFRHPAANTPAEHAKPVEKKPGVLPTPTSTFYF